MLNALAHSLASVLLTLTLAHSAAASQAPPSADPPASALPAGLFVQADPPGSRPLAAVLAGATPGQSVVVSARIGRGAESLPASEAAMLIVDRQDSKASAQVRVVDAAGRTIPATLRAAGAAPHLDVIIKGTVAELPDGRPPVIHAQAIRILPTGLPDGFFLAEPPAKAAAVIDAKKTTRRDDTVTVHGRIGGSVKPFVDGRAVFTIVGRALKSCDENPDDHCKTPWDFCCDTRADITLHSATIQVLDAAGRPLKIDLKGRGGLVENVDVTVTGQATVADGKSLVVKATGIHVHAR